MDAFTHMDFIGSTIMVDVINDISDSHEAIRIAVEKRLEGHWRVIGVEEQAATTYMATLDTELAETPEYVLIEVLATYDIQAVENGPIVEMVEGKKINRRMKYLHFTARLTSDGKLMVTDCRLDVPSGK